MLVLSRKIDEEIKIGDNITLKVVRVQGGSVRLGIEAPNNIQITRGEISYERASQPPGHNGSGVAVNN